MSTLSFNTLGENYVFFIFYRVFYRNSFNLVKFLTNVFFFSLYLQIYTNILLYKKDAIKGRFVDISEFLNDVKFVV